jgi:hypothetical protein
LANESLWGPIDHGNGSSRAAHAQQFLSDKIRPRREHRSDQASHDVEARVLKRECLGVGFFETSREIFGEWTELAEISIGSQPPKKLLELIVHPQK